MHEMSIAQSLIGIIQEEMKKHELTKLRTVRVKYGKLAAIVPDSLQFAFEACVIGTPLEGATLEMELLPLKLKCGECGTLFSPEDPNTLFVPCPKCGEGLGHEVLQGKELYLDNMEAE
ncbi:hydrogenase nickel incorporation protein HypA/HybF [Desulfobaculum xiamenense]|uniref:Hydrogenase maturation factor HypA n=1 Tax=Desulfobaculum xiamenense TaxID=995050 RepID=A0A846QCV5_9BACT|nr:hydrogenase maturation nickel metallochaperone HypA [Desulfobaculum xiamenense]NJB66556.1 hydrogenase nickel incorporation protein HypA/HybF [Desulfobaculum xiamenense]